MPSIVVMVRNLGWGCAGIANGEENVGGENTTNGRNQRMVWGGMDCRIIPVN